MRSFNLYDSTVFTIPPPPEGFTLDDAKEMVVRKIAASPPELTGGGTRGATPGSDDEMFLWYILSEMGSRVRWGTAVNMVTAIGWPAKANDSSPVGKVSVIIDSEGAGVAELLSTGAVAVPDAFSTKADAISELAKAHGIAAVTDGDSVWTIEELNKIAGAFALVPAGDRGALAGLALLRVRNIAGAHAGEFGWAQSVTDTFVLSSATIKIADGAFMADSKSFVGCGTTAWPASYLTILHEAGHAVASLALRNATATADQATAHANSLAEALNTMVVASNAAGAGLNALIREYNELVQRFNNSLADSGPEVTAAAKSELDAKNLEMDAKREEAHGLENEEQVGRTALESAKLEAMVQQKRPRSYRPPAGKNGSGEAPESKRVQDFVEFVTLDRIPPLTQYAKDNWPFQPEEFFAEAYSLWLTDPEYMEANAKPLLDWFIAGNYLK